MSAKKTHIEVAEPEISVRELADFMSGSERKRRAIVECCKYRSLARLVQHQEARIVVASAIRSGHTQGLKEKADFVRNKLVTDDFEALTNEANADYIERFGKIADAVELPAAEILPGKKFPKVVIGNVKVRFVPSLLLERRTKTNKLKCGALMLRYAKGKTLPASTGSFQSAAIFGLLTDIGNDDGAEPEKTLCLTLDAYSGALHVAPGASVSMYANMKAACASIAERWPNIPPPKDAVL